MKSVYVEVASAVSLINLMFSHQRVARPKTAAQGYVPLVQNKHLLTRNIAQCWAEKFLNRALKAKLSSEIKVHSKKAKKIQRTFVYITNKFFLTLSQCWPVLPFSEDGSSSRTLVCRKTANRTTSRNKILAGKNHILC